MDVDVTFNSSSLLPLAPLLGSCNEATLNVHYMTWGGPRTRSAQVLLGTQSTVALPRLTLVDG